MAKLLVAGDWKTDKTSSGDPVATVRLYNDTTDIAALVYEEDDGESHTWVSYAPDGATIGEGSAPSEYDAMACADECLSGRGCVLGEEP